MAPEIPEDDRYEDFVRFFTRDEAKVRSFVRTLLPTWEDVDEVMQNTGLVLWRKFDQFDPETNFLKWAYVVARFEVLHYRRTKSRDRHIFDEELLASLAEAVDQEADELSDQRLALDACLKTLPENSRRLIVSAYAPGMKINQLAQQVGKTPTALYKALNRIREKLQTCIEKRTPALSE